jgi:hypothetical protein
MTPALRVVEEVAEEPALAAHGQRIDDDVEQHHENAGQGEAPISCSGEPQRATQTRGVGEELERQGIEEGTFEMKSSRPAVAVQW